MEFLGDKITGLLANIITESMYAQCEVFRKKSSSLESFADYRTDDSALSVKVQKVLIKGRVILRKPTAGWDIRSKWKDGSTSRDSFPSIRSCTQYMLLNLVVTFYVTQMPDVITHSSMVTIETVCLFHGIVT